MTRAAIIAFCLAGPAAAQGVVFDFAVTQSCIERATSWEGQLGCIGSAAGACMDASEFGFSTVGQSACFDAERGAWDAWLNRLYPKLLEATRHADEDRMEGAPSQADALREMQRAWIGYRDKSCEFEASIWGGGTGAGPAFVGCLMVETGEQVLRLNSFASQHEEH